MAIVISIVSYPFLPARVGGQKGIALFNRYFSRHLQMICVTTRANDPDAAEGYEVLPLLSNSPLRYINPCYFFTVRRLIRQYTATHVLLEHPYYGWLGILLKWFTGVKLVVHSHNLEGLRWKSLGKWWWSILWIYEKYTHRAANYNFFIHEESRDYAIRRFGLDPAKCLTMTYGIEQQVVPSHEQIAEAKQVIRQRHGIASGETILLFNGAFRYSPNIDALRRVMDIIQPLLDRQPGFSYRIIICGPDVPEIIRERSQGKIIFTGFVEDMANYGMGADIFINPVTDGGGIKTKLIEALAYNLNAVSTETGAIGIHPEQCNGKLLISPDGAWENFVGQIILASQIRADTPPAYFNHFYWGSSTQRAAAFISP